MSKALTIPDTKAEVIESLPSEFLYKLELAGGIASEVLDERVIQWTKEGWTQREIAKEMGCGQSTVSDRQARLGIRSLNKPVSSSTDRAPVKTNGNKKRRKDLPAMHLPDVVAEDALENLRTQLMHWFELGRHLEHLMKNGTPIEPKSKSDRALLRREVIEMKKIATQLREVITNAEV